MDVILGITTEKEVIVITSRAAVRGVSILKTDDDKTRVVAPHTLLAYTGEAGDTGMRSISLTLCNCSKADFRF